MFSSVTACWTWMKGWKQIQSASLNHEGQLKVGDDIRINNMANCCLVIYCTFYSGSPLSSLFHTLETAPLTSHTFPTPRFSCHHQLSSLPRFLPSLHISFLFTILHIIVSLLPSAHLSPVCSRHSRVHSTASLTQRPAPCAVSCH